MRVLLDECVPAGLASALSSHEVRTVSQMGWNGKDDGPLLDLAASQFDVLLTVDQKLRLQQNLATKKIGVVVLKARRSSLRFLRPLAPQILDALPKIRPGRVITIGA